jgi:hypothetical protein
MTEGRLAVAHVPASAWRDATDACARVAIEAGLAFPLPLVSAWRGELDAVETRVRALERSAPGSPALDPAAGDGAHALLALASARLGTGWLRGQLIDVAAAVELAYRATRHHDAVSDCSHASNKQRVRDGDWAITEAAVLVADVGPVAYRLLVRGYGAAQLVRLEPGEPVLSLLPTAVSLGALVAGAEPPDFPLPAGSSAAAIVWQWASSTLHGEPETPLALLADG